MWKEIALTAWKEADKNKMSVANSAVRSAGYDIAYERVRSYIRHKPEYKNKSAEKRVERNYQRVANFLDTEIEKSHKEFTPKVTGVVGDLHTPYDHPNYLKFCQDTFQRFGVERVVCVGDIIDHHAISRFQSEPNSMGAYDEMDISKGHLQRYVKAFPNLYICEGNHDSIPYRQAASIGIGERYLKTIHEMFELPDTWIIEPEFIINGVLYKHGINCLGKDGAFNAAVQERMSTVIGHAHSKLGCKYTANKRDLIFGMSVGCGIDVGAYAFAYGKHDKERPILGCGIVFNDSFAITVPMSKEYFRN